MLANKNCTSAWENHTAGCSAQNGGRYTATLDSADLVALVSLWEVPTNVWHGASRHFRTKRGNIWKTKLISLQQTVKTTTLYAYIEDK
jgi:hypothetical protein